MSVVYVEMIFLITVIVTSDISHSAVSYYDRANHDDENSYDLYPHCSTVCVANTQI